MKFTWARAVAWGIVTLLCALGFALYSGAWVVPSHLNPWAPLDVMAQPNALTGFKLARARSEALRCKAALAQTGMQYDEVPDRETGAGCGFDDAVRLRRAPVRFGAPLMLSCPMALSFFMWERNVLQPAAAQHFGQPAVSIEHLGSYACRNINRGERETVASSASRSRHATANALDLASVTLRDGRRVSVLKDWTATDDDGRLLRDLHNGACRYFDGVLGPDYNAVHRDHFHLETGGFSMCR